MFVAQHVFAMFSLYTSSQKVTFKKTICYTTSTVYIKHWLTFSLFWTIYWKVLVQTISPNFWGLFTRDKSTLWECWNFQIKNWLHKLGDQHQKFGVRIISKISFICHEENNIFLMETMNYFNQPYSNKRFTNLLVFIFFKYFIL